MKLIELAFSSYIYSKMTDYDKALEEFTNATDNKLDLKNELHVTELLIWLNKWGCRQFAKNDYPLAINNIMDWYKQYENIFQSINSELSNSTDEELSNLFDAYKDLSSIKASDRNYSNNKIVEVTIGPTGAAKILYALKPYLCVPWDEYIRKWFIDHESKSNYLQFLYHAKNELIELQKDCSRLNIKLGHVPQIINREKSTLTKLVDEYFWITITKNCSTPSLSLFNKWILWS